MSGALSCSWVPSALVNYLEYAEQTFHYHYGFKGLIQSS